MAHKLRFAHVGTTSTVVRVHGNSGHPPTNPLAVVEQQPQPTISTQGVVGHGRTNVASASCCRTLAAQRTSSPLRLILLGVLALCTVAVVDALPYHIGVTCNSCLVQWSLFTQNMYNGIQEEIAAQNASDRFVLHAIHMTDTTTPDELVRVIANLSHIVTSSSLAPTVFVAALSLPSLLITVMDPMRVPEALMDRTQNIAVRDDQVGYLAGVLAGSQSQHGYVAFVGGPRILPIDNMRAGFFSGVLAVCPACSITSTNVNAFSSASVNTTELAHAITTLAPDVVWTPGGAAGSALLVALSAASIETIGVDADEYTTTMGGLHGTPAATMLLSSSEKRTSVAVRVGMHDYIVNPLAFRPSDRLVGVQQNCIDLSPCHESCWRWTARANETASTLVRRLKLGLVSTGVDTNTGYLSLNRRTTSISVSRPPISATQHVAFASQYVLTVACWGLIVVFDGRWNVVTLYDDALQTILQVLVVVPPTAPPVLGGGHSLVPLTFAPSGVEAVVLLGGRQNGAVANTTYALVTVCATPGLCTHKATWRKVAITASNSTRDALPPLAYHAAAALRGTNRMYVAGGMADDASAMDGTYRLDCTLSEPMKVACTLRRLTIDLPRPMHTFTLAVWGQPAAAGPLSAAGDMLIVSGGADRVLAWRLLSVGDDAEDTWTAWEDGTAAAQALNASIRQQPCVFRRDTTTVVVLGVGAMGESLFLRPTHPVAARRLIFGGARSIYSASVLAALTQEQQSCAVLLSAGTAPTTVGYAGWSPSLLQTNFHQVFLLGVVASDSTQGLVQYSVPWIACDASRGLLRADDLISCVACVGTLANDTCTPPAEGSAGIATTTITVVVVVVGVFVIGLGVGLVAFGAKLPLALVRLRGRASTRPPLQFPLSIVFVNLCGSAHTWQTNPALAGKHLRSVRAAVAWAAQDHDCYLVKVLADSFLLAASNPEAALRFAVAMQELTLRDDERTTRAGSAGPSWLANWRCFGPGIVWPGGLTLRIVLHHGSRVRIQASEGNGYDYSGPDVQEAIAGRWCATGATRDIAVALDAYGALCCADAQSNPKPIERYGVVHAGGGGARGGVVLGNTTYMILRPASMKESGPADVSVGAAHPPSHEATSAEDVHVEMPNFFAAEEIEPSTSASEAIMHWQRSVHAGASTTDVMHMFNAFETQQLTQFVAWAVDAAMMPLPTDTRRRLIKALCANVGASADRPSAEHVSSLSSSTSAAAASSSLGAPVGIPSHVMHRLAMSLLAQLDAMELREALAELHPGPSSEMATLRSLRGSTSPPNEFQ